MLKLRLPVILCYLTISSCIDVPLILKLSEKISLTEEVVDKFRNLLLKHLSEVIISKDTKCQAGYQKWLEERFKAGYLPAEIVLATTYMNEKTSKCPPVDIRKHYEKAVELANNAKDFAPIKVSFNDLRTEIIEHKCTEAFLNAKNNKIKITSIELKVETNTLTIDFPKLLIYTSSSALASSNFKELRKEKKVALLATSSSFEPGEIDEKPAELNTDSQELAVAQNNIVPLTGFAYAVPEAIQSKTTVLIPADKKLFYQIPKGQFEAQVILNTNISFSLSDARCFIDDFYEQIREENKKK
jgi:hypothetical protein